MKGKHTDTTLQDAFEIVKPVLKNLSQKNGTSRYDTNELSVRLTEELYRQWYCGVVYTSHSESEERDLTELLRASHVGTYQWEEGWKVINLSSRGRVIAQRGRERRVVHIVDCLVKDRIGHPVRIDQEISVVERRDSESMNPGDWVSFSKAWPKNRDPLVRLYWNVGAAGVARFVEATTRLMHSNTAYYLKCPRKQSEYSRYDAVVLYFPANRFNDLAEPVSEIHRCVETELGEQVSPLVKKLGNGLGLAEDPIDPEQSFGIHRCGLVAKGIYQCISAKDYDQDNWLTSVRDQFEFAEIPIDRPYVNHSSSPEYRLP